MDAFIAEQAGIISQKDALRSNPIDIASMSDALIAALERKYKDNKAKLKREVEAWKQEFVEDLEKSTKNLKELLDA